MPFSLKSNDAPSLSLISTEVACASKSTAPPCVIIKLAVGDIVKAPELVEIVLFEPVYTVLPDFNWSILLFASTSTAELAVSVPAV